MTDNKNLSEVFFSIDNAQLSLVITVVFLQHIFFKKPTPPIPHIAAAVYYIYIHGTAGHP